MVKKVFFLFDLGIYFIILWCNRSVNPTMPEVSRQKYLLFMREDRDSSVVLEKVVFNESKTN